MGVFMYDRLEPFIFFGAGILYYFILKMLFTM